MIETKSAPTAGAAAADAGGPLTPDLFKLAFRLHPAGVALITADAGFGPVALTANSLASVSADPPILMFSVSVLSSSAPTLRAASSVVVHLLDATGLELAQLGAAHGVDRFADEASWSRLADGEPVFAGARGWIRARILHRIDAGGSTIVVAEGLETDLAPDHAEQRAGADGLVYWDRAWHRIGDLTRV